ncbi:hypothetical protein JHK86_024675 [Glycine max]|nr:hypothetical protein JHK86_024675 [Glycine max]
MKKKQPGACLSGLFVSLTKTLSDSWLRIVTGVKQHFKNLSKDHLKHKKILHDQVDVSLDEFTQTCETCITLRKIVQVVS